MQHLSAMNNVNSYMNQQQQDIMHSQFDQDDFLEQMLSSINPPNNSSFPWAHEDHHTGDYNLEDQSTAVLASKLRQHQISSGAAKALMLQQQLMMSRDLLSDHNDVVDGSNFSQANDASVKPVFNGFTGSLQGQTSNQLQHFQAGAQPATNQAAASGSSGGGAAAGQPRQRVRARRGQATDPHSIAERLRRERIAERMKALQELVPNGNKTDKASMLDEIIDYVKFLQLQVKVLSVSRLGGAGAAGPLVGDLTSKGRNGNGPQTASSSNHNEGTTTMAENQVVKMMEEDMGSAMQYLQGKGLCLMPISLATAISTATSHTRNPLNANGNGPTSPNMSVLTAQSGANGGRESSLKDANSVSKP